MSQSNNNRAFSLGIPSKQGLSKDLRKMDPLILPKRQNEWIGVDSLKGWSSRFSVFFKSVPDTLKRELQRISCFSLSQ